MLLAIDTATATCSLALYDGAVRAEHTWVSQHNHSVELLPRLGRLLEQTGLTPGHLRAIAVCQGPGSFNGLRVGVTTAKVMAFSLNLPVVGVGTLEVVAHPFVACGRLIRPLLDAGRGNFCTALYERSGGQWLVREEPRVVTLTELLQEWLAEPTLFCGELRAEQGANIRASLGEWAVVANPASGLRRAGHLAELAWERLQAGRAQRADELEAMYLPRPRLPRVQ